MILYGLIVGLPTAVVAGPIWMKLICAREAAYGPSQFLADRSEVFVDDRKAPNFGIAMVTVLLPLALMVGKTHASPLLMKGSMAFEWVSFIGDSLIALALSICFAYWSLGLRRRLGMGDLLNLTNRCSPPLLGILLVVGAGGTFNDMLVGSGNGKALADVLGQSRRLALQASFCLFWGCALNAAR